MRVNGIMEREMIAWISFLMMVVIRAEQVQGCKNCLAKSWLKKEDERLLKFINEFICNIKTGHFKRPVLATHFMTSSIYDDKITHLRRCPMILKSPIKIRLQTG